MKDNRIQMEYEDIINLPHHVSKSRPQMERSNRAAQFSPFAALKGYEEAIEATQIQAELHADALEREQWIEE